MSYKQRSPIAIIEGGTNTQNFVHVFGVAYYDGTSLNNVAPGTSGFVLTSNGVLAPSFQAVSASGAIITVNGDSGSATPSVGVITISGGATGLTTLGSSATLNITGILLPANGGTGANNAGTSGQILIGDGTKYVSAAPTSGTGITVGLGAGTMTVSTSALLTATSSSGTATVSSNNITFVGAAGVTTSATGSTVTITGSGSGGIAWNNVTGATQAMAVNNGYISNDGATLVTMTLPSTASVGAIIQVQGAGSGLWTIAQNAGQIINFNAVASTTGVTGSVSSTSQYDSITLICITANTTWAVNQSTGNLSVA